MTYKFTKAFHDILYKAAIEARSYGHAEITPEHVVSALCDDTDIKNFLKSRNIDVSGVSPQIEDFLQKQEPRTEIEFAPNAYSEKLKVIFTAADGISKNPSGIDTIEVMIALATNLQTYAGQVLRNIGFDRLGLQFSADTAHTSLSPDSDPQRPGPSQEQSPTRALAVIPFRTPGRQQGDGLDEEYDFTLKDLPDFCLNLTQKARNGDLEPAIGRDEEIEQIQDILRRRKKCNPLLVGEPGVGKTAIVEGFAWRVANGLVSGPYKNANIYSINTSMIEAGTRYRGTFEEKWGRFLEEVQKDKNAVLFIDEMHTIMGLGASSEGGNDASSMLRPLMSGGKIRVIGTTTEDDLSVIENDGSILRRVQKITIEEPSVEKTVKIVARAIEGYEDTHNVDYSAAAIRTATKLSHRYLTEFKMPDVVFDVLDDAGVARSKKNKDDLPGLVTSRDVEKIIAQRTGIKVSSLSKTEAQKLINLEATLNNEVIDQPQAISTLSAAVRRSKAGINDPDQPLGSFLLLGPTGVGKTESAKQLAAHLDMNFVRIDMSEFMEKHSVSGLIGSPRGYIGYGEEGQLTGPVRKKPHTLLLLDEIEKAHPDIFNILLQVMDHGELTDSKGRRVDFRNTLVIMTTNAGVSDAKNTIGFTIGNGDQSREDNIAVGVNNYFTPEFRNRLSGVVTYHYLQETAMDRVAYKFLAALQARVADRKIIIDPQPSSIEWLVRNGTNRDMGARPMRHLIRDVIETNIADAILGGPLTKGGKVTISFNDEAAGTNEKGKASLNFNYEALPKKSRKPANDAGPKPEIT